MNGQDFLRRITAWRAGSGRIASVRLALAAMIAAAVLPVTAIVVWRVASDIAAQQTQVEVTLARAATGFAQSAERELASSIDALTVLSRSELFQQERIRTLGQLLHGRPRRDWDSMFVLDADGSLVLDTGVQRSTSRELPRLRDLHRQVLQGKRPLVASLGAQEDAGPRSMAIALPVMQNGRVRYVLGARLADGLWQRLADGAEAPEGARASIFDDRLRLLGIAGATTTPSPAWPAASAPATGGPDAGVGRASGPDGQAEFAAWHRIAPTGWLVRVALPAAGVDASRSAAIRGALATFGISLLIGLLLAGWIAYGLLRSLGNERPSR